MSYDIGNYPVFTMFRYDNIKVTISRKTKVTIKYLTHKWLELIGYDNNNK